MTMTDIDYEIAPPLVPRRRAPIDRRATVTSERRALARLAGELRTRVDDLERSNRELREFASVAAHDLASPLCTVTSYLQLVRRRASAQLDPDALELFDLALESTGRMRDLIEGLLDHARAATIGEAEWIDGTAVAGEVLDDLGAELELSGARVHLLPLPRMLADRQAIARVLHNLIANAMKFAQPGAPIEIWISAVEHPHSWELCVADAGVGVDPADAHRIFGRLERAHDHSVAGAGIGLAVCENIVARHRGRIWTEPRPGGGSRFCFTIARPPAGLSEE
jgi:two-component system, chemotaxis family, sensor kinase Cph1